MVLLRSEAPLVMAVCSRWITPATRVFYTALPGASTEDTHSMGFWCATLPTDCLALLKMVVHRAWEWCFRWTRKETRACSIVLEVRMGRIQWLGCSGTGEAIFTA